MKVFKYFIVVLVLSLSGLAYAYANVTRLVLIDYSSFKKIDNNLYISGKLPANSEERIISMLADARNRISDHYGEPSAAPIVVVLGNKEELKNYGINGAPGLFLFAPWGEYLLLDYQTAGIDVAAHELVHAEVVSRVGYLKRQFEVPTWFDEGVAMQVDYRPQYISTRAIEQAEFDRLISLDTPAKFWSSDKEQNLENYRMAKSMVSEIFNHSDESLYSILAKIHNGEESAISSIVYKTNKALQP